MRRFKKVPGKVTNVGAKWAYQVVRADTELVLAGLAKISCTLSPAFQNEYGLNSVTGRTRVITMKG